MSDNSISLLGVADAVKTWIAEKGGLGCMGIVYWLQFPVNRKLNEKSVWDMMLILFFEFHSSPVITCNQ